MSSDRTTTQPVANVPPTNETEMAPFHVLMESTTDISSFKRRIVVPRLENDYLTKRQKAFQSKLSDTDDHSDLWVGTSQLERQLVQCCENDEDNNNEHPTDPNEGGTLDKDKEIRFLGILARDCHTMASRCLALAILERTLETHLNETEEDLDDDTDAESQDGEDTEGLPSDDEHDGDWMPGSRGKPRSPGSRRKQRQSNEKKTSLDQDGERDRLDDFLAGGGLKILNRWLIDASTPVAVPSPKSSTSENAKEPPALDLKPSPMRPLILPILSILEHMPFDKKLVMESKINKQIRKLEKQLDGILEARAKGRHRSEDLLNWTIQPPGNAADALEEVREAINAVKEAWGEMAKKNTEKIQDPFQSLKNRIRNRLDILTDFEAGRIQRPDWFVEREEKKKKSKLSTKQLAAKERQSEREDLHKSLRAEKERRERLQKSLRAAQDEHKLNIARLRQKLIKQQAVSESTTRGKRVGGKSVRWKDSMLTKNRNRELLEEVFVFPKELPPAALYHSDGVTLLEGTKNTDIADSSDDQVLGHGMNSREMGMQEE